MQFAEFGSEPSPEQVHIAEYEGYETMVERTRMEMRVNSATESASKQCFLPNFGLQMARLLLKDQSPTNYEAMLSAQLRSTDASSTVYIAEGPLAD